MWKQLETIVQHLLYFLSLYFFVTPAGAVGKLFLSSSVDHTPPIHTGTIDPARSFDAPRLTLDNPCTWPKKVTRGAGQQLHREDDYD